MVKKFVKGYIAITVVEFAIGIGMALNIDKVLKFYNNYRKKK